MLRDTVTIVLKNQPVLATCCTKIEHRLVHIYSARNPVSRSEGTSIWHKTPQDQVLGTNEIYLPQRDKGWGIREKDRRQRTIEKGKGYLSQSGTKDHLWIERRQMRHIGKQQFIKIKGETLP